MKIKSKISAFTLNEMLLVLAIIGILLLIALPQFMPLISKTKAQEAKIQLKHISNLQTQYRYINSKYSMDFVDIDFEEPKTVEEGGTANYIRNYSLPILNIYWETILYFLYTTINSGKILFKAKRNNGFRYMKGSTK